MESKYNYDIIRDYLHGVVDIETARKIRELIRTDEVARNIAAGILQLEHEFNGDEKEIEAYIEQLRQKQLSVIKTRTVNRTWMRLAAAILIIAIAAPVLWLTVFRSDNILDKELSEPYPLAALDRSESDGPTFRHYINGQYIQALEAVEPPSADASVIFYKGLSALYGGSYDHAITILNLEVVKTSRYHEQAEWFRSLALIKAGKETEAKEILRKISNDPSHFKSATALALLQDLE